MNLRDVRSWRRIADCELRIAESKKEIRNLFAVAPKSIRCRAEIRNSSWYVLDFVLVLMIIGPILGPLFHASGFWLLDQVAHWIIYPLGVWICPQDQHAIPIMSHAMTVCTRCYAAIGGLFLVRLALTSDPGQEGVGSWLARTWGKRSSMERLSFIISVITLWQIDLWAERLGWWSWGQGMLIATGPIVGLAIGFLAYGLAARLTGVRPAWN